MSTFAVTMAGLAPIGKVNLVVQSAVGAEPWPAGLTMTVWAVAVGAVAFLALINWLWFGSSAQSRVWMLVCVRHTLAPWDAWRLRELAKVTGVPLGSMLISHGVLEAALGRADGGSTVSPGVLASGRRVKRRLFGS